MERVLTFSLTQINNRKEAVQVEILKNCANWYIHTSWSNQVAIGIIMIATMALITKYGLMKMSWSWLKISSPWKLFWKIVSLGAIVGICYGIYLLVNYFTPPKSERLFKQIIANQIEVQTKGETANLEEMAESSGTSALSPDKLRLAQKNRTDADKKRKNLEAMLKKPEEKAARLAPAPVYKWIFGFKAEPEDIINANGKGVDQICYRENDVVNKPYFDKNEIRFKYKTSKNKTITAILDKKSPSESHFLGMVDLPDQTGKPKGRKLIIRLKETSMPDKFDGVIETWDGKNWYPQIPAFLKKVQVQ